MDIRFDSSPPKDTEDEQCPERGLIALLALIPPPLPLLFFLFFYLCPLSNTYPPLVASMLDRSIIISVSVEQRRKLTRPVSSCPCTGIFCEGRVPMGVDTGGFWL